MKQLDILWHLGNGDMIICNAIARFYAKTYDRVRVPCYSQNYNMCSFMFRDNKKIEVHPVEHSDEAVELFGHKDALKLGFYAKDDFDPKKFDQEFYRQAKVLFDNRWDMFHVDLEEVNAPFWPQPFAFIHEDFGRGFLIRKETIKLPLITPKKGGEFFSNYTSMKACKEIHCINSSFLHFWDSMPEVEGQKLFYHKYARRGDEPTLKKKWEIL